MSKIKISADSTCDLSREILDKFDISIIPLTIVSNGTSYKDMIEITPQQIFKLTEETGKLCSTSAVNVFDYTEFFKGLLDNDEDKLIHICISSDFSTCYRNACLAAEEFNGRVLVIDSRNLSTGMGHVVYEAALLANQNLELPEIESRLKDLAERVDASFVIDKLEYLKQGGRCSAVKAFGAAVLQLKPAINVIDGKMTVGTTYRGSFEKCLKKYVKERLANRENIVPDRCFITYSSVEPPELATTIHELVESFGIFDEIIETTAGGTISCHCGPNTLGILFVRRK